MSVSTIAEIDRQKFQSLIGERQWTAKEFHKRWQEAYRFTVKYNNFMELINNNVSWKLVYALTIAEMLESNVNELFSLSRIEHE